MAFDGLVMSAVKIELENTIMGGRIEKIYQPLSREIALIIHKDKSKHRLLVSAHARDARIHLTSGIKENPLSPPMFCMVLRKHIEGGRITSIRQSGLERVLCIEVEAKDELGMLSAKTLLCEVMGKHSNIILVDPASNIVLDGINRYSYATSRHREILPGRQYVSPPESGKLNPFEVTEDNFRAALWDPDNDIAVEKLLLNKFEGLSPQTCQEIAVMSGIEPSLSTQFIGDLDLYKMWRFFQTMRNNAANGLFNPTLCSIGSKMISYSAFEQTRYPLTQCKSGSMCTVLDEFYSVRERQELLKQAANNLLKTVGNEIRKCKKKITIHEDTIKKSEEAETLKLSGELITANIFQIPHNETTVELVNYYDPEAKKVSIQMNSRLTPAENAQAYFKRYTKSRHGRRLAAQYLEESKNELAYLDSVVISIEQAEENSELAEIKSELIKEGYIKPEKIPTNRKKANVSTEPSPHVIDLQNGLKILIGRNNRQNDYVTMKMAGPEDLWLHVKDIPGSHVLIKASKRGEFPPQTIQKAAEIAAYYSKARNSSKVSVDYTLRKHVRKPKGAKPGMVIYDSQKTILVEPKIP